MSRHIEEAAKISNSGHHINEANIERQLNEIKPG